jgi:uncharacterized protein (TIGR03083 family)
VTQARAVGQAQMALEALAADRAALLEIGSALSVAEWAAPSGCPGWSVQDVVAHVGALYWVVADPTSLPDAGDRPTEAAQEFYVESRRSWSATEVLGDYEAVSTKALEALHGLAELDLEVPLGDLGTYRAAALPSAFAFDHFLHIRSDLFAPRGPLTGTPPPSDELHVAPALDWIEGALPQQNVDALGALSGVVEIELSGPGARVIRLGAGAAGAAGGAAAAGDGDVVGRVRSDSASFVRWVSQRMTWEDAGVERSGSEVDLAIVRSLRVF